MVLYNFMQSIRCHMTYGFMITSQRNVKKMRTFSTMKAVGYIFSYCDLVRVNTMFAEITISMVQKLFDLTKVNTIFCVYVCVHHRMQNCMNVVINLTNSWKNCFILSY